MTTVPAGARRFTLVGEADDACTAGLFEPTCSDHGLAERLVVIDQVLPAGTAVAVGVTVSAAVTLRVAATDDGKHRQS